MKKGELKIRLKLLKMTLKSFLEELDYNNKHLNRYKEDEDIPLVFEYALLYLEQVRVTESISDVLKGHKKILSLLVKKNEPQEPKIDDMCLFWNKNSEVLLLAPLGKIEDLYYPKSRVKRGYQFCEKFVGNIPKKFYVKFFSITSKTMKGFPDA